VDDPVKKWSVIVGELYFGGIGGSFANHACIGWVMTRLREHAEELTSMDTALAVANVIGGQVIPA
jgi:Na+-translocating ferredoxin:NAD+ oxidoreductase RnfD subunit